ncbi:MAG: MlaD family protein [Nocardioidaceae bacterium]
MRGRARASLAASPVLVGAVAVLIAIVAVYLSYNANSGLPFVPTYDLEAELPNAANLVPGNDVRIGGARVGTVSKISAEQGSDGRVYARLRLELDKDLEPLPVDTTMIVRPRSALGLKYLELEPGTAKAGLEPGATIPVSRARPRPVELDTVLNMFDARTRTGARGMLRGFGDALAGRGESLNAAIAELRPLLDDLQPVARDLADPSTRLARLVSALAAAAREAAPVAEQQAELFANLDVTFAALAGVARPYLGEAISESPPTLAAATEGFPRQRRFIRNTTALLRQLRPGVRTLRGAAPTLASALEAGTRTLPRAPAFNRRLADAFDALADFSEDPLVERGIGQLTRLAASLEPTLRFLVPAQTRCNYVTLWLRNLSDLLSEGDRNGTWQRFIIIATPQGPNNEGSLSSAAANGGGPDRRANYLHQNPYPNTAAPGQTPECEAANERFLSGRRVLGNVPGNQGASTDGQVGGSSAGAER